MRQDFENVYQYFEKNVYQYFERKRKCLPIFWKKTKIFTNIMKEIEYLEGEETWSPLHLRFAEGCLDSLEICDEH